MGWSRIAVLLIAATGLCVATGCAHLGAAVQKPTATVVAVRIGQPSLTGVAGQLELDVSNPNPIALPLKRIDWRLEIGGAAALSGRSDLSEQLPANGRLPVVTSLRLGAVEAARAAVSVASGDRSYRLAADLWFDTPVGDLVVTVDQRGEVLPL